MSKEDYGTGDSERELTTCEILKEEIVHLKWRVLVFACFLTFGSYYIYDFPGAIGTGDHGTIQAKFVAEGQQYSQAMNQLLYSVYSWPNTVLAIFGGLLIDKFLGLRRAMILFTVLVTCGSVLFYVGLITMKFPLMVFARVIFGLGGESLSVAQSAFVARWFCNGRGMALAFGITVSFARVGSSFNFLFSPMFASSYGIDTAVMMGMFACAFSLLSCFVLVACDVYGTKVGIVPPEAKDNSEAFHPRDVLKLPSTVWVICAICVFTYTGIFPFIGIAKNFFQVKYGYSGDDAARWVSLYQFTCAGGSPIVGGLVDSSARNSFWLIAATGTFTLIHILFLITPIPGPVMMAWMGVTYSMLVSSLWPAVPYAVDESVVGFAYGVMTALQNLGLAVFPIVTGVILDQFPGTAPENPGGNSTSAPPTVAPNVTDTPAPNSSATADIFSYYYSSLGTESDFPTPAPTDAILPAMAGYRASIAFFLASTAFATAMAVLLLIMDKRGNGILSASASQRKQLREEQTRLLAAANEVKINKSGEETPTYA